MAKPTDKASFGEFCLRKLGKPVITINVSPDQVEDRIDEALQVFSEKHYDATEKEWVAYRLTAEDLANNYITVPDDILVIDKLLPLESVLSTMRRNGAFSFEHQMILDNLSPFQPLDMINYTMVMTGLEEINQMLNVEETFEFTRHKNRLKIHNTMKRFVVGSVVCFHAYRVIDPETNPYVWNDKWLKQYATALIKQQWGSNMKKHGEIQLLGGVTVNGQQIFDEATQEIQQLEEQLTETYTEPPGFFIG